MAGTKANRGETRIDVDETIMVICHMEFAGVLGAVAVTVANEGTFPLRVD